MGPYSIIYADPPWQYNDRRTTRKDGAAHHPRCGFGAANQYRLSGTEDLCRIPVGDLGWAASVLLLWCTPPCLPDALRVMQAWGYKYKTIAFSWRKTNKDGSPWFGVGYYAKSNEEHVLLGTRGSPMIFSNSVSSAVSTIHTRIHSAKPPIIRSKIVQLFGPLPRIELFARTEHNVEYTEGWDLLGDEVGQKDTSSVSGAEGRWIRASLLPRHIPME